MIDYLGKLLAEEDAFVLNVHLVGGGVRERAGLYSADATGLVIRDGPEDVLIPWHRVDHVTVEID